MALTLRQTKQSKLTIQEMDDNFVYATAGGATTTVVNISSAEILAMGTSPIGLLPAPGSGKFYDYHGYLEFTYVTTAYFLPDDAIMLGGLNSYTGTFLKSNIIGNGENCVCFFGNTLPQETFIGSSEPELVGNNIILLNEPVVLSTWNSTNPTLGNGTLRAIITYTVRTFGA
jgi:hypothetical protein